MKNTNKYVAPVVELISISSKEACMLETSRETTEGNIVIDFGQL